MIQTVKVPNFNTNNLLEKTELKASADAGSSSLSVINTQGLVAGFAVAGNVGMEPAELVTIQSTTGANTVTLTGTTGIAHYEHETLQQIFGNQVQLYRAPNVNGTQPADSEFEAVGSPVTINVDEANTALTDPDGGADWWYKFIYINSISASETDLSASKAVRGGGGTNYCSLWSIRHEAGFDNAPYITDQMIDEKRQAAQKEVDSTLTGLYTLPFTAPVNEFISDITVRLAAGLLLTTQFTSLHSQQNSDGEEKKKNARADLQKIATGQSRLTDQNGQSISISTGMGAVNAWPNADTATSSTDVGGAPRVFRMGDIVGYEQRKY